MNPLFVGAGVAIITPFDKEGQIDFNRFSKLIEIQIATKQMLLLFVGQQAKARH